MSLLLRAISEIEQYLNSPMRNGADWWEKEERMELLRLLMMLRVKAGRKPWHSGGKIPRQNR
jgi:hypothetical protein